MEKKRFWFFKLFFKEFHGEVEGWYEYCFLVLPFLVLIVTIPLNWINSRELLPQSTASVINYLVIILLLGTILRKKREGKEYN